tara:strand:- start:4190 stop:5119 length:930 start_codon:yes stop_codon:yes gene_type:complete
MKNLNYTTKAFLLVFFIYLIGLYQACGQTPLPLIEDFEKFDTIGRWTSPGFPNTGSHNGDLCYNTTGTYELNQWMIFESPLYDLTPYTDGVEIMWHQEVDLRNGDRFRLYYLSLGMWYYYELENLPDGLKITTIPSTATLLTFDLITYGNGNPNGKYAHIGFMELTNPTPLPVELLYFNGSLEDNGVQLEWSTASEANSDYYELYRATDSLIWNEIGVIPAAGNSNSQITYHYFDPSIIWNTSYYKLEQVDFDGTTTKSWQPIAIIRTPPKPLSILMRCDLMGREVSEDYKGLVIEYYSDGSSRKLIKH